MDKLTIRTLRPGDEAALEEFLLGHLDSSMFLLGNMRAAGLVDRGQRYEGTYVAAIDGDRIGGCAAHFWNQNVILQAPDSLGPIWQAVVTTSPRSIKGIIGPADQVAGVIERLSLADAQIQLDETERLYHLDLAALVEPPQLSRGELRGRHIESRDVDLITRWRIDYEIETIGERDTPELRERCRAGVEQSLREGRTWVLDQAGNPVACSSFNSVIREAVQIGGVWTPPEWRSRGYGRCVVAASLVEARAQGIQRAILFTGETNWPAQKAYEAIGFRLVGGYRMMLFQTALDRKALSQG